MTCGMQCAASMCPLIAKHGSAWTGEKNAPCPEHSDLDSGGCPWWTIACGTGAIHEQVKSALDRPVLIISSNRPRHGRREPSTFDCPNESVCSWQKVSADLSDYGGLCPPRYALSLGLDPRFSLF